MPFAPSEEYLMSVSWKADGLVLTRSENGDRFKRNFLRQAVCELRFPTLLELGDSRPPSSFVKALRKDYPHLELSNELTFGLAGGNTESNAHIFRSAKLNWTVSLKQNALSIETTSYTEFNNLRERILQVVKAAESVIDSDFFTRIGLRYINVVSSHDENVTDWINPVLTAPITSKNFGGINEFGGRMNLVAEDGGCLLQHGIQLTNTPPDTAPRPNYLLDIDTYRSVVQLTDVAAAVDIMHRQAFDIFDWAISDTARSFLSKDIKTR